MRSSLADALASWTKQTAHVSRLRAWSHLRPRRTTNNSHQVAAEQLEDRTLLAGESIAGVVWNDTDADGIQDAGEAGLTGQTLYLDLNKNGVFDEGAPVTTTIEPGDFANGTELTQAVPGVTLGSITSSGTPWDSVKALNGRFAHRLPFGTEATFWGSSFPTMVVAFDQPADFFSVNVTGFGATAASRAWLRAYNEAGTLIAEFISDPLATTTPTTLTISAAGIDHVLVSASSGVVLIEELSFRTPIAEPTATTDANGAYVFSNLLNGNYVVRPVVPNGWEQTSAGNEENVYYATGYDGNRGNAHALLKIHAETGQVTWIGNPLPTNLSGIVRTNDGRLYATSWQTDRLYEIDPSTGVVTNRGPIGYDVVAGLAYDPRTDTLYTLGAIPQSGINQLLILNRAVGRGIALGPGITGLVGTAGLAIDTANERVIAFDNNDGEFYEYRLADGVARRLSLGPNVRTWGFSQGPHGFVLQAHGTGDGFLRGVNPDTAQILNYNLAMSQVVRLESLDWNYDPNRYVIPFVRTLIDNVNFGLAEIVPPSVIAVKYGYGTDKWVDSGALDRIAPWQITKIAFTFNRDVAVKFEDLIVTGVNVASYRFSAFAYDVATRTAVWTLATVISNDRITVTLDGDDAISDGFEGVRSPVGYLTGGDSIHSLDVLYGDVNGDGTVNLIDALLQRGRNGTSDLWGDIDGNGTVNLVDALLLRGRNGTKLPQ